MNRRDIDPLSKNGDCFGNNAAVTCPVCGKVFVVSGFLKEVGGQKGERKCPICKKSTGVVPGSKDSGETAYITWNSKDCRGIRNESLSDTKSAYEVTVHTADQLSADELDACIAIIVAGEAVEQKFVTERLPKSTFIAVARCGFDIVGVGVIKGVYKDAIEHARSVAGDSKFYFDPKTPELGYVAVCCKHRGRKVSRLIVERLVAKHPEQLFATTSNPAMKSSLEAFGFQVPEGSVAFKGRRGDSLLLWIRSVHVAND